MIRPLSPASPPLFRARAFPTVALTLVAILAALALADSGQARALAHNATCVSTGLSIRHGSHKCAGTKKDGAPRRRRVKRTAGRHHAIKKADGRARAGGGGGGERAGAEGQATDSGEEATPAPPNGNTPTPSCSDGADASAQEDGSFACPDGSEPGCTGSLTPVLANDGSTELCEPAANGEEEVENEEAAEEA